MSHDQNHLANSQRNPTCQTRGTKQVEWFFTGRDPSRFHSERLGYPPSVSEAVLPPEKRQRGRRLAPIETLSAQAASRSN